MKVTILGVGKIKEKFYREAIDEYAKRLSRYCNFEIIEVADEQTPDGAGEVLKEQIKAKEAERLLARIKDNTLVCTLEIAGKRMTSEQFALWMNQAAIFGRSNICFIIGGSLGLHRFVTDRADFHLSFSDMTFPHQLMRVILSEQIYRAFRINSGEPYHK